jgi:hypothetical protein
MLIAQDDLCSTPLGLARRIAREASMAAFDPLPQGNTLSWFRLGPLRTWHLQRKLMLAVIPTVALLLIISGYLVNLVAVRYINTALERTVKIQVLHMAHIMEIVLNRAKEDLLVLSRDPLDGPSLRRFLQSKRDFGGGRYRELIFSPDGGEEIGFADNDAEIVPLPSSAVENARPVLAGVVEKAREMEPGAVTLSDFVSITYPRIAGREVFAPNTVVLRMAAPVYGPDGKRRAGCSSCPWTPGVCATCSRSSPRPPRRCSPSRAPRNAA